MSSANSILSAKRAALVVIDIQERLAAAMEHRDRVIARTVLLARTAAIVGIPVVVTRQYPKGLGDHSSEIAKVLDEIAAEGAEVTHVDKVTFDCFAEPEFVSAAEATGRRQLLVTGMETHICVCQTTLAALRGGYDVHVAIDACCSREQANHDATAVRLAHAGAVISTSESAAYELVARAATAEFKELLEVVKGASAPGG